MRRLDDALRNVACPGLDAPPVIYFIEAHPAYDERVTAIFERIASGEIAAVTSVITLTEVLTLPVRAGDERVAGECRDLLLHSERLNTMPVNAAIAERAAELRARYQLRTPDALQIATALQAGCQAILTNDDRLQRVAECDVLVLNDLVL